MGDPGAGKTFQARHFMRRYGNGIILSLEGGLVSVSDASIPYLPISSWDNQDDPLSFRKACKWLASAEGRAQNYKWLMLDSLSELSDMAMAHVKEGLGLSPGKEAKANNFKVWEDYATAFLGGCRWLRSQPLHVIMTCHTADKDNDDGGVDHRPLVQGSKVATQLVGMYDYVFALTKKSIKDENGVDQVARYIICDAIRGYQCKARDPKNRIKPYYATDDVTTILDLLE